MTVARTKLNPSTKKLKNKSEEETYKALKKIRSLVVEYESERIPYIIEGNYIPDFPVKSKKTGRKMYIEYKGHFRPEAKRKMVAVKKLNPHLDIRIVFYKRKLSDVRWAERHGFPYAIGTVPEHWVEELNATEV